MKHAITRFASAPAVLLVLPLTAAAADAMTPGLYEYTVRMNVPGAPSQIPPQTIQRCLRAADLDTNPGLQMLGGPDSDCKMRDMTQNGGQFAYKVACTKPQKLDGAVKGTTTRTTIAMDMTVTMDGAPGPMSQSINARRIGDCK
jgi:hypothetical protein